MSAPIPVVGPLGKMSRRFAAVTLFFQSFAVFFGALAARGLAHAQGDEWATTYVVAGSALAVACLVTMVVLKQGWGVTLGWVLQVVLIATGVLVPSMFVIGVLCALAWWYAVVKGGRMDRENLQRAEEQRRWEAENPRV